MDLIVELNSRLCRGLITVLYLAILQVARWNEWAATRLRKRRLLGSIRRL